MQFAFIILSMVLGPAQLSSSSPCEVQARAVTIQIHDYAQVPHESLSRATNIVTAFYERIGVHMEWAGVLRKRKMDAPDPEHREALSTVPVAQLTMIILSPKMAAAGRIADGVLGYAAVAHEGMGRIAYAIYDRVRSTAGQLPKNDGDLLGYVMTHEIGHLLLPRGPQPEIGVMKGRWSLEDFRQLDLAKLEFSAEQANQIHSTIDHESRAADSRRSADRPTDRVEDRSTAELEINRRGVTTAATAGKSPPAPSACPSTTIHTSRIGDP